MGRSINRGCAGCDGNSKCSPDTSTYEQWYSSCDGSDMVKVRCTAVTDEDCNVSTTCLDCEGNEVDTTGMSPMMEPPTPVLGSLSMDLTSTDNLAAAIAIALSETVLRPATPILGVPGCVTLRGGEVVPAVTMAMVVDGRPVEQMVVNPQTLDPIEGIVGWANPCDCAVNCPKRMIGLKIEKYVVTPGPYTEGMTVTGGYRITNTTFDPALDLFNITVTDDNGVPSGTLLNLPSGAVDELMWTHVITADEASDGVHTNTATVQGTTFDGTTAYSDPSTVTLLVQRPSPLPLVQKLSYNRDGDAVTDFRQGETISWEIVITVPPGLTVGNIKITDVVPAGLLYVPGSISGGDTRSDARPDDPAEGLSWKFEPFGTARQEVLRFATEVRGIGRPGANPIENVVTFDGDPIPTGPVTHGITIHE